MILKLYIYFSCQCTLTNVILVVNVHQLMLLKFLQISVYHRHPEL